MSAEKTVLYHGPGMPGPSPLVSQFAGENALAVSGIRPADDVRALLNRTFPACVVLEIGESAGEILELCRSLKHDTFTAIVPLVVLVSSEQQDLAVECLEAGADEVVHEDFPEGEKLLRFQQVLRRADRDVSVHPTTRLPGTSHIARDMAQRLDSGEKFAVCYADLDHFKEFNDRYGYTYGDGVIKILSRILRDMVRGLAPGGFVGHIGGDDFIFNVPVEYLEKTCDGVIELFDELIPYQYTEEDRRAGYFLGKDRRGHIHRIPLMTLSIGIVTNQFQEFEHTGQISELAAEMKTYAKTLTGSLYVVDRRHQLPELEAVSTVDSEPLAGPETAIQAKSNT
jgi:GGDEF domain-containing protein